MADVAARLKLNKPTIRTIDRGELRAVLVGPRRVRIRKSELDQFIAESAAMMGPTEDEARAEFFTAQEIVRAASTNEDLRPALQRLAVAATKLARALPRG